ncbi:hypothetical protein ACMAY6_01940 [Luminiphilus sp. nBUS_16]|uniref:hypothetical protein n=1 Tax=Luminiphilus sp. nBUS_16 TaxID=3395315 RepID=UPI003EBC19A0
MHQKAMSYAAQFFDAYTGGLPMAVKPSFLDTGSQVVHGGVGMVAPGQFETIGRDFRNAKGVNILLENLYALSLEYALAIEQFFRSILGSKKDFENEQRYGESERLKVTLTCQNDLELNAIRSIAAEKLFMR